MVRLLDLLALFAQLGDDHVDALLLDGAQSMRGHAQRHPALLRLQPETLAVPVRQEPAATFVVRVRDAIARSGALASDFADAGHRLNLQDQLVTEWPIARTARWGRALYQPQRLPARRREQPKSPLLRAHRVAAPRPGSAGGP